MDLDVILCQENFSEEFTNMVHNHIPETKDIKKFFLLFTHYSLESTKLTAPYDFHEYKIHTDFCDYAGVVYLTPDPPQILEHHFMVKKLIL